MSSFFERLGHDVKRSFWTILGFGSAIFILVFLLSYRAIFSNEYLIGISYLKTERVVQNTSLRVVDPKSSIVFIEAEEPVDLDSKMALIKIVENDPDMYIVSDVTNFSPTVQSKFPSTDAVIVVGLQSGVLKEKTDQRVIYWYSSSGNYPSNQIEINQIPVRSLTEAPDISRLTGSNAGAFSLMDRDVFVIAPGESFFLFNEHIPSLTAPV